MLKYEYRALQIQKHCRENKICPYQLMAQILDKTNDKKRTELVHDIGDSKEECASILGISTRTWLRLEQNYIQK